MLGAGSEDQGMLAYTLGADGCGADLLQIPDGGSRLPITPEVLERRENSLIMDGPAVFKWAVRTIADSTRQILDHLEISIDEIKIAFFHQANIRIIEAICKRTGIPIEKSHNVIETTGNPSSATIPLCMAKAHEAGEKVEFGGKQFAPLYTPKNDTLISLFHITDDEQRKLRTLISRDMAAERHSFCPCKI